MLPVWSFFFWFSHRLHYHYVSPRDSSTCDLSLPMHSINSKTCILSLFEDDKTSIFTKCNFRPLPHMIKHDVFELSPTSVLLTNIDKLTIKCPNETNIIQDCTFCVHNIPCRCLNQASTATYQPRLVHYQENSETQTRAYPLNLALIHEFFGYDKVKFYLGNTYFKQSVNITIPDFKIYTHKFKEILASDKNDPLSLKRMVKSAKKDDTIFQSLSEPILDGQLQLSQTWPDLNGYLGLISITLGLLYILYHIRTLKTSLFILQVHNVHIKPTQPSFLFTAKDTSSSSLSIHNAIYTLSWGSWNPHHWSYYTNDFDCYISITSKTQNRNTTVMLELTSGGSCVSIPVTFFPLCPSYWEIQPPIKIQKISLDDLPSTKLSIEWPGFKVINKLARQNLKINTDIKLGMFIYFKEKLILNQPFCSLFTKVWHSLSVKGTKIQHNLLTRKSMRIAYTHF